jgi:hypothetical protein
MAGGTGKGRGCSSIALSVKATSYHYILRKGSIDIANI